MITLVATQRPSAWVGCAIVFGLVAGIGIVPALVMTWYDDRKARQS